MCKLMWPCANMAKTALGLLLGLGLLDGGHTTTLFG